MTTTFSRILFTSCSMSFFSRFFFPLSNQWVLSNKTSIRNGEKRWKIKSKSNWLKSDIYFFTVESAYEIKCTHTQHWELSFSFLLTPYQLHFGVCLLTYLFFFFSCFLSTSTAIFFFLVPFFRALFEHGKKSVKGKKRNTGMKRYIQFRGSGSSN